MRYLVDTHVFLWFITDDPRLSLAAKRLMESADNELILSPASHWEMAIKVSTGKLKLTEAFSVFVHREIAVNGFSTLPIEVDHTAVLTSLPYHHRDPFDRMLIAQATVEQLPIVSIDAQFDAYGVTRVW